jgi:hypothetical protein
MKSLGTCVSDELVHSYVIDPAVGQTPGVPFGLPPTNHRWINRYGLAMTAIVNLVVNGLLAWLTTIGHAHIDLVAVPLTGAPSLVTDTLGTLVILPITTSLLCSIGVRGYRRRGLLDPITLPSIGPLRWVGRLPSGDLGAGLILGTWTAALLGPGGCALLVALSSSGVSRGSFVIYKAVFGVALGAVITPAVALRALAQPLVLNARP